MSTYDSEPSIILKNRLIGLDIEYLDGMTGPYCSQLFDNKASRWEKFAKFCTLQRSDDDQFNLSLAHQCNCDIRLKGKKITMMYFDNGFTEGEARICDYIITSTIYTGPLRYCVCGTPTN